MTKDYSTMTDSELLDDCIAHWERMIAWARGQDGKDQTSLFEMKEFIKECWGGADCALCRRYGKGDCANCPLDESGNNCLELNTPYSGIDMACTWSGWLPAAENMLKVLKELREKE